MESLQTWSTLASLVQMETIVGRRFLHQKQSQVGCFLKDTLSSALFIMFHLLTWSHACLPSSGDHTQLDLDSMVGPSLGTLNNDEAAMAVIMSLLETDANLGEAVDFDEMHWSL